MMKKWCLLVVLSLSVGCSCEEDCDEMYEDCLDEGRPEGICDKEKRACKHECDASTGRQGEGAIQE